MTNLTPKRLAAVVLAAGASARLGSPKQLVAWHGKTLVRHAAELALAASSAWGDPITAYPTPAAWIEAGGKGIAILNWSSRLLDLFDGVPRIETKHLPPRTATVLADRLRKNFFKSVPFVERPRKETHNAAA